MPRASRVGKASAKSLSAAGVAPGQRTLHEIFRRPSKKSTDILTERSGNVSSDTQNTVAENIISQCESEKEIGNQASSMSAESERYCYTLRLDELTEEDLKASENKNRYFCGEISVACVQQRKKVSLL